MYDDIVSSKMKGVDSAWLYFNKSKEDTAVQEESTLDFILHNLELMWWDPEDGARPDGLTLTTSIVLEGLSQSSTVRESDDYVETTPHLNPTWTTTQLIESITNNYDDLWDTCLVSQQGIGVINKGSIADPVTQIVTPDEDDLSQNDPWLQTVARYALRTGGVPCTIKDVELGLARVESTRIYTTYVITIEIPFIAFNSVMAIVNNITTDFSASYTSNNRTKLSYPNGYYTKQAIRKLSSNDLEIDDSVVTRPYMPWTSSTSGLYESLWYGWGGESVTRYGRTYLTKVTYALRADVLENPRAYGLTYKELNNYILPLLDSDYRKKKASGWKKFVAIVVFVVAVIFSVASWGLSLKLGTAIMVALLVVTALSMALSAMGATEWALAFSEVSQMMEPLTWIAAIYLIVTGVSAALQAAKEAAAKEAGKALVDVTAKEIAKELLSSTAGSMVDSIISGATDILTSPNLSSSLKLLNTMLKMVNQVQKFRLEDINDRNKDLASEYEKAIADSELESDILRGFARVYASPATADWSMFAGLFDLPYEGTGGPLHTGNAQRTTKQAIRKAKYDDPVFNDILII